MNAVAPGAFLRFRPFTIVSLLIATLILASCGKEPTGISTGGATNTGSSTIDPGTEGEFLLAVAEGGDIIMGRLEVWGYNLAFDPDSGTVSFDAILVNATERPVFPPIRFVIIAIQPSEVSVVNPDGRYPGGAAYFDYSDKLGPDSLLSPFERSSPSHFVFHTGSPRSFVIDYRLEFSTQGRMGVVAGVVFFDIDTNGERDRCEPGLMNIAVTLESNLPGNVMMRRETHTDAHGRYAFDMLPPGIYILTAEAPFGWRPTTPNPVLVTLLEQGEDPPPVLFGMHSWRGRPTITLFGPLAVGPASPYGSELDSTFVVEADSCSGQGSTYYLDVIYPPIGAANGSEVASTHRPSSDYRPATGPLPPAIDTVGVTINGRLIYHFRQNPDSLASEPPTGTFLIEAGVIQAGENSIGITVQGGREAALFFRVHQIIRSKKEG